MLTGSPSGIHSVLQVDTCIQELGLQDIELII